MNIAVCAIVERTMNAARLAAILPVLFLACASETEPQTDADPYDLFADQPCSDELALDLDGDGEVDMGWCRYDCGGLSDAAACPTPLAGEAECTDVGGSYACAVRCDPSDALPCADGAECLNVSADNFVCTYVNAPQ